MKKLLAIAAALAIGFALAGCSAPAQSSSSASSETASLSASDPSASASESASSEAPAINWNTVKTAAEAAKGAGFDTFGVIDSITIDEMTFKDPAFSYADGVAQAAYEVGATGLYVRKADGAHKAPLTDRSESDFAYKWAQKYEGFEVSMWGPEKDAATVVTWADDTKQYGVTYQGLGGEEMTLDAEEVAEIVKGIKDAESPAKDDDDDDDDDADDQQSNGNGSGFISADDAKSYAVSALGLGLPETVTAELIQGGDAPHYEVVLKYGTEEHIIEVDAYTGDIWSDTLEDEADDDDDDDDDQYGGNDGGYISEDEAKSIAVSAAGMGLPEEVTVSLVEGGDAPHYEVTLTSGDESQVVEVDAYSGDVW